MTRDRERGAVHGGSVESIHAPLVSKRGDKMGANNEAQTANTGLGEQSSSETGFMIEKGKPLSGVTYRVVKPLPPGLSPVCEDEPMSEQAQDCMEKEKSNMGEMCLEMR